MPLRRIPYANNVEAKISAAYRKDRSAILATNFLPNGRPYNYALIAETTLAAYSALIAAEAYLEAKYFRRTIAGAFGEAIFAVHLASNIRKDREQTLANSGGEYANPLAHANEPTTQFASAYEKQGKPKS